MPVPFPTAPQAAVEDGLFRFGRYSGPIDRVNFLDARLRGGLEAPRWLKSKQLKEWRALTLADRRWQFHAAFYNAKFFSLVMFRGFDRETKKTCGFVRILPGSIFHLGETLAGSTIAYHGRHARLDLSVNLAERRIDLGVAWRPGGRKQGFRGLFELDCGPKAAAMTSLVLPIGQSRAMYTAQCALPFRGSFETEGEIHRFEGEEATGLMEDTKGYFPFSLRYDWVVGLGIDAKGRHVGFRLANSQIRDPELLNENSLWIGTKVWALPAVRVTRATGHQGSWVIQDTEGLVDLLFTPESPHDISFHLGLIESDWHGPFGSFKGFVKSGEGETIEAERLCGMGEEKYLRA